MKKILLILCLCVMTLAGCGKSSSTNSNTNSIVAEDLPIATITVKDYGTMKFALFTDVPNTTNNFISLANNGFYNGLTFHRLIPNFVIQGGDPVGDGTGGPGYSIKGEFNANKIRNDHNHEFGALAMARGNNSYDSAGSQFYITLSKTKNLDGEYAVFGQIISGEDVLKKLNKAPVGANDRPEPPIIIESISVDTKGVQYSAPEKLPETH